MPTPLRSCPALLVLLLAACGPVQAVPEGGETDTSGGGSSADDDSNGTTTPTGGGPGGGSDSADGPTGDAPPSTSTAGDESTGGGANDTTTVGDDATGGASAGRLVGLGLVADDETWNVVELDRFTGELQVLASLPAVVGSVAQGVGAFDAATRRIFHPTGDRRLLVFDADTGEFLGTPALVPKELSVVANLEVNDAGALVALSLSGAPRTATIDPDTGSVTALAALPADIQGIAQGTGAIDRATNRIFAVTGEQRLLVLDAGTGALQGDVPLLLGDGGGVGELVVNNAGELVALRNNFPASWDVVRIDPPTGALTPLSQLAPEPGFAQGQALHDPAVDHMLLLAADQALLVVDAGTGELLASTPIALGMHAAFVNPMLVP